MNFNDADEQTSFDLIPANTIAKARLVIKTGNDVIDPLITNSKNSGPYAKRKIFDKIGLSGSDTWVNMGKARIRAILESARGINPKDMSEPAIRGRQIDSFQELNNLDVVIKIGIEYDKNGQYQDKIVLLRL